MIKAYIVSNIYSMLTFCVSHVDKQHSKENRVPCDKLYGAAFNDMYSCKFVWRVRIRCTLGQFDRLNFMREVCSRDII